MAETAIQFTVAVDRNFELLIDNPFRFSKLLGLEQRGQIDDHVVSQLEDKDGAPTLVDFSIGNIAFDPISSKGSFRVHFKISRQFCCSDISSCQTDYMDFTFTKREQKIDITGSYILWSIQ